MLYVRLVPLQTLQCFLKVANEAWTRTSFEHSAILIYDHSSAWNFQQKKKCIPLILGEKPHGSLKGSGKVYFSLPDFLNICVLEADDTSFFLDTGTYTSVISVFRGRYPESQL